MTTLPEIHKIKRIYPAFWIPFFLLLIHCSYYLGWTIDDPYISYRYAENLVAGNGLVFNPGEYVEGYSNFLFTLLLALFRSAGLSAVYVSRLLGFVSLIMLFWFFYRALDKELYNPSNLPLIRFFALYFIALDASISFWGVSGLETGFYTLLLTMAWIGLVREDRSRSSPLIVSLIFTLVALCRPEGILFFAVCWFSDALRIIIKSDRNLFRRLILRTIPLAIIFLIYNFWRFDYYDSLLPNTFYAKATGDPAERIAVGIEYSVRFILFNGGLLFFLILIPLLGKMKTNPSVYRAVEFCVGGLFFVVYSGGDWMPFWRFMAPLIPMLGYLMGLGLHLLWNRLKTSDAKYKKRDLATLVLIALFCLSLTHERHVSYPIMSSVREGTFYHPNIVAGQWLKTNTEEDAKIAGEEAGIIAYYSERYFIDMIGIVDSHIARLEGGMHEKFDIPYLLGKKPDFIVIICKRRLSDDADIVPMYPSGSRLMAHPDFHDTYTPVVSFLRGNDLLGFSTLVIFKRQ